jgi:hypothetical protein
MAKETNDFQSPTSMNVANPGRQASWGKDQTLHTTKPSQVPILDCSSVLPTSNIGTYGCISGSNRDCSSHIRKEYYLFQRHTYTCLRSPNSNVLMCYWLQYRQTTKCPRCQVEAYEYTKQRDPYRGSPATLCRTRCPDEDSWLVVPWNQHLTGDVRASKPVVCEDCIKVFAARGINIKPGTARTWGSYLQD